MFNSLKEVFRHIGHRGAFLALVATAFVFYGIGLYLEPAVFHHTDFFVPFAWWPRIFFVTGAAMFLTGISRPKSDSYAFGIATFISAWWSMRWFHAWYREGGTGAWPTAFTWVLITLTIILVATWPEYQKTRKCRESGGDDDVG